MAHNEAFPRVDSIEFFQALVHQAQAHPEVYQPLGTCDLDLAIVMERPNAASWSVLLHFQDYASPEVRELSAGEEQSAHCFLVGTVAVWEAMVDDIRAHGEATGRQTLNSLALLGNQLRVRGADMMGVDRFMRFNQTLQAFFDGAASIERTQVVAS